VELAPGLAHQPGAAQARDPPSKIVLVVIDRGEARVGDAAGLVQQVTDGYPLGMVRIRRREVAEVDLHRRIEGDAPRGRQLQHCRCGERLCQ
jgi:hypothetical protein